MRSHKILIKRYSLGGQQDGGIFNSLLFYPHNLPPFTSFIACNTGFHRRTWSLVPHGITSHGPDTARVPASLQIVFESVSFRHEYGHTAVMDSGNVELNPGLPTNIKASNTKLSESFLNFGSIWSVVKKASPLAIKVDITPLDYSCLYVHREIASCEGGLALVYRQSLIVKPYLIDDIFFSGSRSSWQK